MGASSSASRIALQLDLKFRGNYPRLGGAVHGPWCGARGFLAPCKQCGASIYFWRCDHMRVWLPFEAWVNGRVEEGFWVYHGGVCCCDEVA